MNEKLKKLYYSQDIHFPIIGAVLEGKAEGKVFCDNVTNPRHIFVISKFGFCQEIFEKYNIVFWNEIRAIIESNERMKLRMYNPCENTKRFLEKKTYAKEAKRKRYVFGKGEYNSKEIILETKTQYNYSIRMLQIEDIQKEDFGLDLSSRYYRNSEDFIQNAIPLVACDKDGVYMGIVYSAGNDKSMCEVDIYVDEKYRKQGIATQLVKAFVNECKKNNKIAVWDCYSDLFESYHLAEKVGFSLKKEYSFYNIERPRLKKNKGVNKNEMG